MRAFSRRLLSCFMLCIFMSSLGTHIFNTSWLTHDLYSTASSREFSGVADDPVVDQARPADLAKSQDFGDATGLLSNAEHKLLHSADPAQPLLLTYIPEGPDDALPRTIPLPAREATISPADPEPPFRPPRGIQHA